MAPPSSPFCVNWSHKANTDEQIQWWELMRLLWVDSRNAAQRPPASHTWKSGGGDCYTPSWLPPSTPRWPAVHQAASHGINQEGGVMKAHVHTPWNTMSEPGRGRELSHLMLDSHWSWTFIFLWRGGTSTLHFLLQKSWISMHSVICILIKLGDCLVLTNKKLCSERSTELYLHLCKGTRKSHEPSWKHFCRTSHFPRAKFHSTELIISMWTGISCPRWNLIPPATSNDLCAYAASVNKWKNYLIFKDFIMTSLKLSISRAKRCWNACSSSSDLFLDQPHLADWLLRSSNSAANARVPLHRC